ncbi:MAG: peptidylprolyl isomerase [Elusimicrobia bacterium]|nr:peptidylprolyl isomerase [Elusimicrobiota bacterium]
MRYLPLLLLLAAAASASDGVHRAQEAFLLGQKGLAEAADGAPESPAMREERLAAASALLPLAAEPDPLVRAAAVEGLGKTGAAESEAALLAAARDPDAAVRAEAALAFFRQRLLKRVPEYSTAAVTALATLGGDQDAEVRWRAVYAFSRWAEPRAAQVLTTALHSADPRQRLFALRGLTKLGPLPPAPLLDEDPYVRAESVGAYGPTPASFRDPSPHVRAAAAAWSGSHPVSPAARSELERMADSDTAMPRGESLVALARLGAPGGRFAAARADRHWWVRSKAYEATSLTAGSEEAVAAGLDDPDPRVAAGAMEALAASSPTYAGARIAAVLRDAKAPLELLGTAADAAAARGPEMTEALLDALKTGAPGLTAEVRGTIRKALRAAAEARPDDASRIAAALAAFPEMTDSPRRFKHLSRPASVVIKTEKGVVVIELDPAAAPNHAAAFVDSVKRRLYDGTVWHRIVSGFVVQGGDPRGSGWGDDGWRLEDEPSRRRFLRGTVGMPKAGKDTGGCQLFFSLVPTPHLDGRYTVFGSVVSGLDVLDRLEPGDRIISARLKKG